MLDKLASIPERVAQWAGNLSGRALVAIGVLVLAGVAAGGYYSFQTYDYVQHDNEFCVSCHLMQQPADLFAESPHQGLGCKACHQPTLMARSQMALSQILENPDEIHAHADVPNERCAACHIEGDPDKWRHIAASAGHRVHLESDDPSLQGLQCVECHATSVHQFAPVDATCSQSACHGNKEIVLEGMKDLTIRCSACHNFLAPVDLREGTSAEMAATLEAAILPDQEECFSCHVMRTLVSMPEQDAHAGMCSACHNPHEHVTPSQAVQSCATAGCHTQAADLSPMHRGMQPGVLEDCTACHKAHDFRVLGSMCIDCHQDLARDSDFRGSASGAASPHRTPPPSTDGGGHPDVTWGAPASPASPAFNPAGVGIGWWRHDTLPPGQEVGQERPRFLHGQHQSVSCTNCHTTGDDHGSLRVVTLSDCRSCHHRAPVANDCTVCHEPGDASTQTFEEVRPVRFSVGTEDPDRVMTFDHTRHSELACASCHTEGLALSAAGVDCTQCHQEHHQPAADCASCHRVPTAGAHPAKDSHVTCSGAGCHQAVPFDAVPRSRAACLVCHQEQTVHRPGRVCIDCHTLPGARPSGEDVR